MMMQRFGITEEREMVEIVARQARISIRPDKQGWPRLNINYSGWDKKQTETGCMLTIPCVYRNRYANQNDQRVDGKKCIKWIYLIHLLARKPSGSFLVPMDTSLLQQKLIIRWWK